MSSEGRGTRTRPLGEPSKKGASNNGASVITTRSGEDGRMLREERFRLSFRKTVDKTFVKSPGVEPDLKIVIMLDLGASGFDISSAVVIGFRGRVPKRFLLGNLIGVFGEEIGLSCCLATASTTASRLPRFARSSSEKSSRFNLEPLEGARKHNHHQQSWP